MVDDQRLPNILFLFADQLRPDWHGMNPDIPIRTPNIEALAERGTRFTNAVCPSPVCNPSRACIASGFEYDRCNTRGNVVDYDLRITTYYERLRDEAGYRVMGCGKFDLATDFPLDIDGRHGIDRWGFSDAVFNPAKWNTTQRMRIDPNGEPRDPYTAYLDERGWLQEHITDYDRRQSEGLWTATFPTQLPDEVYYDNWITQTGLELLDETETGEPWFLEVNFQNPHHPWDVTERMHAMYRDPDVDFPRPVASGLPVTDEEHAAVRRNYSAMVTHLDECVGRFIDALEARGELENTLIVFSSDHGEMLGDHGQWQKLSPYQASVGVPLIVAGPDVADQDPVDEPVTILDLHSTFLDYAGVPPASNVDSRSMRALLAGETNEHREVVYSGLGSWRMVYDGQFKLIAGYDPDLRRGPNYEPMQVGPSNSARRQREREPILFDVRHGETENLAAVHPEVVEELSSELIAIRDTIYEYGSHRLR